MKTEMLWSASGAMTDLAILVTPMGCELEALPPPDTTFRASQVASATLMCSDCGSSEKPQGEEAWKADCEQTSAGHQVKQNQEEVGGSCNMNIILEKKS